MSAAEDAAGKGPSEVGPSGAGPVGGIRGRLFVWLQYVLPQHGLSRLVLAASRVRTQWFKNLLIRGFLRLFSLDMSEAVEPDPYRYGSFNEFFTRALRPEARPIDRDPESIASPVDGAVSECGAIEQQRLIQAKGRHYSLRALLAGQPWAKNFEGGSFATIYLAPFNYHRIHMAVRGTLIDTVYVPGRLFSVNTVTAEHVPGLFARNERILTLFDTDFGRFALVMVGALNVGSMATVWAGDITPAARRAVARIASPPVTLEKGAELGRFNMGSTVIMLFEPKRAEWHPLLRAGSVVQLGQAIGRHVAAGQRPALGQRPAAGQRP
jgi:phosphatidylserine decarboxylase